MELVDPLLELDIFLVLFVATATATAAATIVGSNTEFHQK